MIRLSVGGIPIPPSKLIYPEELMITLYNIISTDGFIARKDGSEDFIPDNLWKNFLSICKEYGTLIIGRRTYDIIQSYDKELQDSFVALPIRKIVVSGNKNLNLKNGYTIVNTPEDAIALAPDALVSSGPILNNYLIKNHLVKEIIFHEIPVLIGDGIKPFDKTKLILKVIDNVPQLEGIKVIKYNLD
ncbi:MAG: dihydrofolate reductase family protein [bacterium]|nr:dihydrofolate reductase family protein [bacterium]